jgi:hypothetical protein
MAINGPLPRLKVIPLTTRYTTASQNQSLGASAVRATAKHKTAKPQRNQNVG